MEEIKTYKFYKYKNNPNGSDYCFYQRPCDSNMSLRCFWENGEICGFMSESLTYRNEDIKEIDMNEFMHDFVKPLIRKKKVLVDYLKQQIDACDGCIDVMTSDLQEIQPRGIGKTYLTEEIFKNKIAKKIYNEILSKIEKE